MSQRKDRVEKVVAELLQNFNEKCKTSISEQDFEKGFIDTYNPYMMMDSYHDACRLAAIGNMWLPNLQGGQFIVESRDSATRKCKVVFSPNYQNK